MTEMAIAAPGLVEPVEEIRRIGRVPVRNLWLLMLYASDLFRHGVGARVAIEENPDDIPDLVAEILALQVELRLRRNLSFGYRRRAADLGKVRGRIDLLGTERRRLLDRGMVRCRFDELTVDTPRNRYVRAALEVIAGIVRRVGMAQRCRSLAACLERMGVVGEMPGRAEVSVDRFGRHDAADRPMVCAARLAFDLALPTETAGCEDLLEPGRDIHWLRKLYEKGVAGFYSAALSGQGWRVDAGKTLIWPIEKRSSGIDAIFPAMRTDIVLDHPGNGRRVVIDTKFNSIVTKGWHREETIRSGYLYQIYAYLRSQEGGGDPLSDRATGVLLHPSVDGRLHETVQIQGHEICFATVDLSRSAKEIREQLLGVLEAWVPS